MKNNIADVQPEQEDIENPISQNENANGAHSSACCCIACFRHPYARLLSSNLFENGKMPPAIQSWFTILNWYYLSNINILSTSNYSIFGIFGLLLMFRVVMMTVQNEVRSANGDPSSAKTSLTHEGIGLGLGIASKYALPLVAGTAIAVPITVVLGAIGIFSSFLDISKYCKSRPQQQAAPDGERNYRSLDQPTV